MGKELFDLKPGIIKKPQLLCFSFWTRQNQKRPGFTFTSHEVKSSKTKHTQFFWLRSHMNKLAGFLKPQSVTFFFLALISVIVPLVRLNFLRHVDDAVMILLKIQLAWQIMQIFSCFAPCNYKNQLELKLAQAQSVVCVYCLQVVETNQY